MKVRIEIDTRTMIHFWLVVIGFVLAGLAIYSARTALTILGVAFFLSIVLSPPVNRLAKVLPDRSRVLGTAIAYLVVLAFLGVIIFLVIPPIIEQTTKFVQNLPQLMNSASGQYSAFDKFITTNHLQPEFNKVATSFKDGLTQFATGIGTALFLSIGSILSGITATILVLVLTFLMLVEGPSWMKRLWGLYSNKNKMQTHRRILNRMYSVVNSYAIGQLSVSSIAGIVSGVSVFILSLIFHIPSNLAVPAAAIIFLLSLIPMFGEIVGVFIVSFILLLNSLTASVIFLVFFVIYAQVEANYISPHIQSKRIDLSALAVLAAVTIGVYLFGIAGGIISIPIAGCINVLIDDYLTQKRNSEHKQHQTTKNQKVIAKLK